MIKRFFRKITGLQKRDEYICYLAYKNLELQKENRSLKNTIVILEADRIRKAVNYV